MSELAPVISLAAYRPAPAGFSGEPWLSKRQIASHFGVDTSTIDRWCRNGMPYSQRGGAHRRFQAGVCERWMDGR